MVGEVSLDAPDLGAALAMLRKTALRLDPQGLRTKILLPNDQIRYLALDTTRTTEADIRRALDGTTPYAVDDLVYDFVRGGGRTYIAAVARETLEEAEAFAAEHRFSPVAFAGVPEDFTFVGEVFFGPTAIAPSLIAPGQTVERDKAPVRIGARRATIPLSVPVTVPPVTVPPAIPTVTVIPSVAPDATPAEPRPATPDSGPTAAVLRTDPPPTDTTATKAAPDPVTDPVPQTDLEPALAAEQTGVEPETGALGSEPVTADEAAHTEPESETDPENDTAEPAIAGKPDAGAPPVPELANISVANTAGPDIADDSEAAVSPDAEPASAPTSETTAAPASAPVPTPVMAPVMAPVSAPVSASVSTPVVAPISPLAPESAAAEGSAPVAPPPPAADPPPLARVTMDGIPDPETQPLSTAPVVTAPEATPEPIIPEPVFASRARALRAERSDGTTPVPGQSLAAPMPGQSPAALTESVQRPEAPQPAAAAPQSTPRAEPTFGRKRDAPAPLPGLATPASTASPRPGAAAPALIAGPATPAMTASSAASPVVSPPASTAPAPASPARVTIDPVARPILAGPDPLAKIAALRKGSSGAAMPGPLTRPALAVPTAAGTVGPRLNGTARPAEALPKTPAVSTVPPPPSDAAPITGRPKAAADLAKSPTPLMPGAPMASDVVLAKAAVTGAGVTALPEPAAPGNIFASRRAQVQPPIRAEAATPQRGKTRESVRDQRTRAARPVKGKPRFLGLILTLGLLLFLAAVAAWAAMTSETGLAGLFGRGTSTETAQTTAQPADPAIPATPEVSAAALTSPDTSDQMQTVLRPQVRPQSAEESLALSAEEALALSPEEALALSPEEALAIATALPDAVAAPDPALNALAATDLPDAALPDTGILAPDVAAAPDSTDPDRTDPDPAASDTGTAISPAEAERIYAATGVWLRAPRLPLMPQIDPIDITPSPALDLPGQPREPAVLPVLAGAGPDPVLMAQRDPPALGTVFERDAQGFIRATPEGTMTPDGILIFAGLPDIVPPTRPGTPEPDPVTEAAAPAETDLATPESGPATDPAADPAAEPEITAGGVGLASLRPVVRPAAIEEAAAAAPAVPDADAALPAFAGARPPLRPEGLAPEAEPEAAPEVAPETETDPASATVDETAIPDLESTLASIVAAAPDVPVDPLASLSPQAIATSRRPDVRPRNFDQVVASALSRQQGGQQAPAQAASLAAVAPAAVAAAAPAAVAPQIVAPTGPVPGGVAQAATMENAINLREINLIGVFGQSNDRTALVRMGNGRLIRVSVGDSLDGGQVVAIGDNILNYVKRGRTISLVIPSG